MALTVCVVVAAAAVLLTPSSGEEAAPVRPAVSVGVVGNALDGNTAAVTTEARRLGAGLIREEVRWSEVEPHRGHWHWGRTDRVFGAAARRHLRVLPLLLTTPRWLSAHPTMLPPSLADWRRFVSAALVRYGPGGHFWRAHPDLDRGLAPRTWEVWNEPWLATSSYPQPDPVRYAHVVIAASQAARQTGLEVQMLAAMTTTYAGADGVERDWVQAMAGIPGLARAIGAVAVHPYTSGPPDDVTAPVSDRFARVELIEQALRQIGVGTRPLWVTEVGWSTCSLRPGCVSDAQQADDVRRLFALVRLRYARLVRAIVLYDLRDLPGGAASRESNFGLYDLAGRPKPVVSVIRRAIRAP